jgi:hypothetical protein
MYNLDETGTCELLIWRQPKLENLLTWKRERVCYGETFENDEFAGRWYSMRCGNADYAESKCEEIPCRSGTEKYVRVKSSANGPACLGDRCWTITHQTVPAGSRYGPLQKQTFLVCFSFVL